MPGRAAGGNVDHVDHNIGVGTASVPIGTGFAVFPGLFQIFFLDDLFALDHTAAAVGAFILTFYSSGSAAGAGFIVFDLGADDLLFGGLAGRAAEAEAFGDPAHKFYDHKDGNNDKEKKYHQSAEDVINVIILPRTAAVSLGSALSLTVFGEGKCVIGIGHRNGVALARRE